jgi:hypothetical protein
MDAYSLYDAHAATTTTRRSARHLPAAPGAPPLRTPLTMSSSEPSSSILQLDGWTPHFGPSSTRATVLAEIIKSCKSRGVARDLVMVFGL